MSEKALAILASAVSGVLLGFVLFYTLFGNGSGEDYLSPTRIFIAAAGSLFFGISGLIAGWSLALCKNFLGSSTIAHVAVGSITALSVMIGLWLLLEIGAIGVETAIILGGISCVFGWVYRHSCRFHQRHFR